MSHALIIFKNNVMEILNMYYFSYLSKQCFAGSLNFIPWNDGYKIFLKYIVVHSFLEKSSHVRIF